MAVSVILSIALGVISFSEPSRASPKFLADESLSGGKTFNEEIMHAMSSMLGCGGAASPEKIASIHQTLGPMWRTLPKTSADRIDRRSLRYLVHRYFMQTSSLLIRGFEPTRPVNDSYWGVADILSQVVPAYVESVLESKHATKHGFGLDDAVSMVLMLQQLIFDSESSLLEQVYAEQGKGMQRPLSHEGLKEVLESYVVQWMVEGEAEDIAMLLANRTLLAQVVPHYNELVTFAEGRMRSLQYAHIQKVPQKHGREIWENKYSFEDAHDIVGGITSSFQSYWQSECSSMKDALVSMDELSTGRVPLSKFYSIALNTDWRFGESEAYLREMGALDESSSFAGPQVIIPNYVQSTSNCIVSTPHYLVCCSNECESLLSEIEVAVGAPTATAEHILQIVRNMTAQTTLDDDDSPTLLPEGILAIQLRQVASTNGGTVPLHGRLFAQWLHYVFPRECPFPHKKGLVSAVTPMQYGDEYIATDVDMKRHASTAPASAVHLGNVSMSKDELQWMSQWSPEEEFIVDYSAELSMPWQQRLLFGCGGLLLVGLGVWAGVIHGGKQSGGMSSVAGRVNWV